MAVERLSQASILTLQKYNSMVAGYSNVADFELISTTLISSNTASVTFDVSTFASTYKHLQVRILAKSNTTPNDSVDLTFNNDTGTNYSYHSMYGNGSSAGAEAATSSPSCYSVATLATSADTNQFGMALIDIVDAFSTVKNKTIRVLKGTNLGSGSSLQLTSGSWRNTGVVTSVKLTARGSNFASGSRLSLYGLRG